MENNPRETGIVHLWNLPEKEVYVKLKKDSHERLIKELHEIFNDSHKAIAKEIKEPTYIISCFEHSTTAKPLYLVVKLYNLLYKQGLKDFTLINLEKQILYIKAKGTAILIYNPKLPFVFNNKNGGRIISAVLHDGCLSDSRFLYANHQTILKKQVYKSIREIFGDIKVKVEFDQVKFPKIIYLVLTHSFKMKSGEKVINNPGYPNFVFNSPETWKSIVDQAISDDGWIQGKSIKIVITVDVTKKQRIPKILVGNKIFFNNLGINVNGPYLWKKYKLNIKGENFIREQWYISISGKEDLEKINSIGVLHPRKHKLLHRYISSYKQQQFKNGENVYRALEACKILCKSNKKMIVNNVAELIKRHPFRTNQIMKKVVDLGWLIVTRDYKNKFCPRIYQITDKGWSINGLPL